MSEEGRINTSIGISKWWRGERQIKKTLMTPVLVEWVCPKCHVGNMNYTGITWPIDQSRPGMHHKCSDPTCGYLCAISEEFPKIEHVK